MGFTFGCDPELFVVDKDGIPVPAHNMIPGTKKEPHKVECGAIQVDGLALEFNIDPVDNFEDWDHNITTVLKELKTFIPKGHKFLFKAGVDFPKDRFEGLPEEALELGCEPDFNAYTGEENPRPEPEEGSTFRSAAGHIHLGWTENEEISDEFHRSNSFDLVKQLDWFLGVPALLKEEGDPMAFKRRSLYGKGGACRVKPYGVEYRVLSNFWVPTKAGRRWAFERANLAVQYMSKQEFAKTLPERKVIHSGADLIDNANGLSLLKDIQVHGYPFIEQFPIEITPTNHF